MSQRLEIGTTKLQRELKQLWGIGRPPTKMLGEGVHTHTNQY